MVETQYRQPAPADADGAADADASDLAEPRDEARRIADVGVSLIGGLAGAMGEGLRVFGLHAGNDGRAMNEKSSGLLGGLVNGYATFLEEGAKAIRTAHKTYSKDE
jgi:hypothetical protein